MKAYELLEKAPNEVNGFKKLANQYSKEDYDFELGTKEEISFYKTLQVGFDDGQFLWYENEQKALSMFVTLNEEQQVQYRVYYMDILWEGDGEEPTEYDMTDDDILFAQSFKEAIDEFIQYLEDW